MPQPIFPKFHNLLLRLVRKPIHFSLIAHFHTSTKNSAFYSDLTREEIQSRKSHHQTLAQSPEQEANHISNQTELHISHPWSEWVNLMELIFKKGYFNIEGSDGHPFGRQELGTKETNHIRTALLNFARDRFNHIRYFSMQDISTVLESGCPSLDRKVVNSGKRLRAHVGVEEGKVCSSCSLRGGCERAYVKAREDEGGRTVDVMRILLTYGLDPITGSVENTPCLNKRVKDSVRRLLSEMVEFSIRDPESDSPKAVPYKNPQKSQMDVPIKHGDWICPKCNFINFAKNIKCLRCNGLFEERLRKLGEDQSHLPLKKGDWICGVCNFLNFAKNTRCLQCKEKPPIRQLNPGEWECPSCNYINFKRNMRCLKCDWRRPKASKYSDISAQNQIESNYKMNFVRDDDEQRKETERSWTNLEDDKNCEESRWSMLEDFPVAQGKSEISQDRQVKERWKKEMLKRNRNDSGTEDDGDIGFRCSRFGESSDDEEMDEWFGYKKKNETVD